jgi:glycosyltransferase involved in cell wall biosynthesis
MKPKVLVLMATFNGEKYLQEQLDSITKQEGFDLHFLFCDDGSIDGTIGILEDFSRIWPVLKILKVKNFGHTNAFVYLSKYAPDGFDYYAYSDQDDIWDSNKLYKSILAFHNSSPTVIGSARRIISEQSKLVNRVQKPFGPSFSNAIVQNNLFGNTSIVNAKGFVFLKECLPEDLPYFDSWIYFIFSSCATVKFIEEPLISYRIHGHNSIGIRNVPKILELNLQVKKYQRQAQIGRKYVERFLHDKDKLLLQEFLGVSGIKGTFKRIKKLKSLHVVRSKKIETLAFKLLLLIQRST